MPASIKIAAAYFCRDSFEVWNPITGAFTAGTFAGRVQRMDTFVSLWHRSSRRHHIFVKAGETIGSPEAIRSVANGKVYLISQTENKDYWQNGELYAHMLTAHLVMPPSGGDTQLITVRVAGVAPDLGPVVLGTPVNGYADFELRTTKSEGNTEELVTGEYIAAFNKSLLAQRGDYLVFDSTYYRVLEKYFDSGLCYARVERDPPAYEILEFKIPSGTPSVYDPATGSMTAKTEVTRQVSALLGKRTDSGVIEDREIERALTAYIYHEHIGFDPEIGAEFLYDSVRYRVVSVDQGLLTGQWKIEATKQ